MMNSHAHKVSGRGRFRIARLACLIAGQLALGTMIHNVQAREFFNPALLEIDNPNQRDIDLSVFEDGVVQAPGIYRVDILVNEQAIDTREVEFQLVKDATSGKEQLQPCLSVEQLQDMGIKTDLFPGIKNGQATCADLNAIPQASTEFRFSKQQLLLSIPQAAISQKARGYVPEKLWDDGIPAFLLNYSLSGANNYARNSTGADGNSLYTNLRPGINMGPWRLRNYTTWNRDSNGQDKWKSVYVYAQRSIIGLKSQLTLGDSSTPADVFDSVPFRGAQMASDEDMMPDSMKGYAPVVRGIARTSAQVIIRQNGYIIYQSYVAPGAFEIKDMYPTGSSGDLFVTVKEADGSTQQFVVPFASLPVLQREGHLKYSITGGQYRSYDNKVDDTPFGLVTAIFGLPAGFTAYGGTQVADYYRAVALGVGKNLGDFGALSGDVTQASSTMQNMAKESGQSWRVRYSKNIVKTGTNFAIAGYRYSTDGYYSLQEVMDSYRSGSDENFYSERRRNRSELTLSQNLWANAGSLTFSWISEDYWRSNRTLRSISGGYNNSWKGISYGMNYSYNINTRASGSRSGRVYDRDQVLGFNLSIPLDHFLPRTWASYNLNTSKKGNTTHTLGLNGTALADNNLSWSVQQGYGDKGTGNTGSMNADYRGTYGEMTAGYAYDQDSQRLSYGLQGGIVGHENGVTFGQPMGETIALVQVPGASNVGINNQTGVRTDWRGYAILPYTSPYRRNQVQLNTETFGENVDLELSNQTVVPTRGAVVRASFAAHVGQRVMMTLLRKGGAPVPFGAMVTDVARKNIQGFIVGDDGLVYLTGMAEKGSLDVKWGSGNGIQCRINYTLTQGKTENGITSAVGQCQ